MHDKYKSIIGIKVMKIATLFKPDDGIIDYMKEQVEIYGKK